MNDDEMWWMAFGWKPGEIINNWNPWCNSNVLLCFLLMENNKDKLAKAVYRSMQSVDKFINFVKSDGACEEGPSYWDMPPANCSTTSKSFTKEREERFLYSTNR